MAVFDGASQMPRAGSKADLVELLTNNWTKQHEPFGLHKDNRESNLTFSNVEDDSSPVVYICQHSYVSWWYSQQFLKIEE